MTLQDKVKFNLPLTDEEVKELEATFDNPVKEGYQDGGDPDEGRDFRTDEEKILDGDLPCPKDMKVVDGKLVAKSTKEMYDEGILTKEKYSEIQRSIRDYYLERTDKYVLIDYPIDEVKKKEVLEYREYLRHLPEDSNWPDVEIKTFE